MACDALNFTGVNQQVWDCIVNNVKNNYGISITQPKGCDGKLGVEICWTWTSASGALQVQCTKKPFIVSCETVNNTITSVATSCGAQS
jgi:hypothetical protein